MPSWASVGLACVDLATMAAELRERAWEIKSLIFPENKDYERIRRFQMLPVPRWEKVRVSFTLA